MEDLAGKQLGPYQIVSQLGIGGMATVFKAYQPKMDRYIALKVLPRHFSKKSEFVSRFSQEARVIAQLEHPHILPVHDFGESDGYTYLAMRLVEGGSLSDLMKKYRKLELTQINRIISQVGGALDYAHNKGVVHRDFKPGNVLIDEFENCLLTDFGIAKLMRLPYEDAASTAIIAGSNHFEVAIAVATTLFGLASGAALATVVGVLTEVPFMLFLVWLCKRTRGFFFHEASPVYADPHK